MASSEEKRTENAVGSQSPNNLEATSETTTGGNLAKDQDEAEKVPASLKSHSLPLAHSSDHADAQTNSGGTNEKVEDVGITSTEATEPSEEDEDISIVYPRGIPLALLTFGLCRQ